jgi:hypothetical protein
MPTIASCSKPARCKDSCPNATATCRNNDEVERDCAHKRAFRTVGSANHRARSESSNVSCAVELWPWKYRLLSFCPSKYDLLQHHDEKSERSPIQTHLKTAVHACMIARLLPEKALDHSRHLLTDGGCHLAEGRWLNVKIDQHAEKCGTTIIHSLELYLIRPLHTNPDAVCMLAIAG